MVHKSRPVRNVWHKISLETDRDWTGRDWTDLPPTCNSACKKDSKHVSKNYIVKR